MPYNTKTASHSNEEYAVRVPFQLTPPLQLPKKRMFLREFLMSADLSKGDSASPH